MSSLGVLPVLHRVVHAIAGADIDAQFPDPFPAELMVAEIASRHAVESAKNCDTSVLIPQPVQPLLDRVAAVGLVVVQFGHPIPACSLKSERASMVEHGHPNC